MLSIGSAAGVALMGQARGVYTFPIHFKWSWAIALGYAAAILTHLLINAATLIGVPRGTYAVTLELLRRGLRRNFFSGRPQYADTVENAEEECGEYERHVHDGDPHQLLRSVLGGIEEDLQEMDR